MKGKGEGKAGLRSSVLCFSTGLRRGHVLVIVAIAAAAAGGIVVDVGIIVLVGVGEGERW